MSVDPCSPRAFEDRYQRSLDPWDFRSSPYEQDRYEQIVAALPRPHYASGFEPGCSIGELTWRLARRCDRLRAVDVSATAVATTEELCRGLDQVQVAVGSLADERSTGHDLVVLSEVGYYFDVDELDAIIDRLVAALLPGGDLVACHWLGHSDDHKLHGAVVHQRIDRHPGLEALPGPSRPADAGFVLDVWRRP